MISIDKLPKIIELNQFGDDYSSFIDAVYDIFYDDFIKHKALFGSHTLQLKFNPRYKDRPYTFYHMTHEGKVECERTPDLRRCERIGWARPCVENVENWTLKFWRQNRQRSSNRVCILLDVEEDFDYFVVLEVRGTYILLWTAFVSQYNHETRKKLKEYDAWKKKEGANIDTPDELIKLIRDGLKKQETT